MAAASYFRRRVRGIPPRKREVIDDLTRNSLSAIIDYEVLRFCADPEELPTCKCRTIMYVDINDLRYFVSRDIPDMEWGGPEGHFLASDNTAFLDLIECCFRLIAPFNNGKCNSGKYECLRESVSENMRFEVNRVFIRDGVAFKLNPDGEIVRTGAPIVTDAVQNATFITGDETLDELLNTARDKFVNRDRSTRSEALDKLWDAWERLKTLEVPGDKRASTAALLDRVAAGDAPFRERLEKEARALTDIGNDFMIRHSETDRHPLTDDRHVDYLFHRMFSLVYLLLDATGRVGREGA